MEVDRLKGKKGNKGKGKGQDSKGPSESKGKGKTKSKDNGKGASKGKGKEKGKYGGKHDDYSREKGGKGERVCHNCGRPGRFARDCYVRSVDEPDAHSTFFFFFFFGASF